MNRLKASSKPKRTAELRWGFTILSFSYHDELCNFKKQISKSIFENPDTCVFMKTPHTLTSWVCTEVHEHGKLQKGSS